MQETLHRLFRFKAWADDILLTELTKFDGDNPVTTLAIRALNHTYVVDQIFAAHLRRAVHPYTSANPSEVPALSELSADLRASDRMYIDYIAALCERPLAERIDFLFTDGAPGRMSREEMLLHVITHGVGHRGQVSALMLLNALAPVRDGFTTYLHSAETAERRRG